MALRGECSTQSITDDSDHDRKQKNENSRETNPPHGALDARLTLGANPGWQPLSHLPIPGDQHESNDHETDGENDAQDRDLRCSLE